MRKIILFLSILSLFSCDDGNFEIPSFEFDTTVNVCGDYVIYRTNSNATEALIIKLSNLNILQEETISPIEVNISNDNTQYRIFDSAVNSDYFCADIPPIEPIVIRNWQGVAGATNVISIETNAVYNTNNELTGYEHALTLKNLVLESNGETLTFENYYFGNFVTSL